MHSTIRERYRENHRFRKAAVFRDNAGCWIRMEPGGPWMGTMFPTWEAAMRGGR